MEYNRQQRDQYGQQSGWGQQRHQQEQWQEGGETETNQNMRNTPARQPGYGEVYHGNLQQREEETNRARGHNYGQQGGMFQGGNHRHGQDYNPGGYGQVGNTGGGFSAWDSYGSSGNDMGRNENWNGGANTGNYGQQGNNYKQSRDYNQQHRGSSQQYGGNRKQDDNDNNWWDKAKHEVSSWFNNDDHNHDNNRNYGMHEGAMAGNRQLVNNDRSGDSRGQHWGKGPRGYQRSEDRIREDVCERLAYDGHIDASDIDVKVEGSEVVLTGTVRSRSEKRRAEDLVESIMGVRNVENRIRVDHEQSSPQRAGNSRTSDLNKHDDNSRHNSSLENHSYTGNSGDQSGIGTESGTTNEIIRNSGTKDTNL